MEVYLYSVHWYFDGDGITNSGVIAAESMGEAVKRLTTEFYDNVEWVKLFALENSDGGYSDLTDIRNVVNEHHLISEE